MIERQYWGGDNEDDDDDEIENPSVENHLSDDNDDGNGHDHDEFPGEDSFQRPQEQDWNDELDRQLEEMMEEMRHEMDHEIQQSIDDAFNAQFENYLNEYFDKAEPKQQQREYHPQEQERDKSFILPVVVFPMDSIANNSQGKTHTPLMKTTTTKTTVADINAQIQLVINQYKATCIG
jgi:hypothetical protein